VRQENDDAAPCAGGNRDKGKRPLMGHVSTEYSDVTIITSDNPRHEDPLQIIEEIKKGIVSNKQVIVEPDRRKAIASALQMARSGDIVFLAGKGHEDYQIIDDKKIHFDDREEVETYIRNNR
ncbi:MAG: UDP-N-acetylmuramoyl-L-alanyl-D-glutamate--2,6-diaminopimelate ligase, partial [bacterium]